MEPHVESINLPDKDTLVANVGKRIVKYQLNPFEKTFEFTE